MSSDSVRDCRFADRKYSRLARLCAELLSRVARLRLYSTVVATLVATLGHDCTYKLKRTRYRYRSAKSAYNYLYMLHVHDDSDFSKAVTFSFHWHCFQIAAGYLACIMYVITAVCQNFIQR